jgi:hydrogenase maturation factor
MSARDLAPAQCHEEHCITCGDEAVRMRVLALDEPGGLTRCEGAGGVTSAVDTALVAPVAAGDVVLVHAGVALVRLEDEGEDE